MDYFLQFSMVYDMIIKLSEHGLIESHYTGQTILYDFSYMEDIEELRHKLAEYKSEHKALDDMIDQSLSSSAVNLMQIQQLKKKKLWLKDVIQKLESALIDDIIA